MANKPALIGSMGDSLRESCGKALTSYADKYENIVILDADIAGGTGMHHFRDKYPDRFIQCGIAEQNMMAMSWRTSIYRFYSCSNYIFSFYATCH